MKLLRNSVLALWLVAACATSLAQPASTQVWGVNSAGQIWQWTGNGPWQSVPGGLTNVSVGSDGAIWGVNQAGTVYRRNGNQWQQMPGGLAQLSVRNDREVWGVNAADDIWRWNGSAWTQVPGKLRNVSVGADGTVWGVNRTGQVFRRSGDTWQQMPGGLAQVSVGSASNIWGVNVADDIWHWDGRTWTQVAGKLIQVTVAADGTVWGVNRGGQIFRRLGDTWQQMPGGLAQVSVAAMSGTAVAMANPDYGLASTTLSSTAAPTQTTGSITIAGNQAISVAGPSSAPAPAQSLAVGGLSYAIGKVGESMATCGVPGKGLCPRVPAELVGNASNECPAGSFADIGKWSCWSCPSGYSRTSAAVDSQRACQKTDTSVTGGYSGATFRGYLCPDGSFHDPIRGGECYSCPVGYRRSAAHIDAANACYVPARENLSAAQRKKNTAFAWDCSAGTFWDGWNGGACWSCPAGYARTGNHINSGQACSQAVPEQQHRATLVQKAQCGPGEFFDMKIPGTQDPKRGGACYTCPTAFERTGSAIDTPQACLHPKGIRFASATQTKPMTCGPGEIFDPVNSNSPAVRTRLIERNALPASPLAAAASGGTCWTCPPGAKRSGSAVYGNDACIPPGINWKSAGYDQPGLFGLKGAEAVALKLVSERGLINDVMKGIQESDQAANLPPDYHRRVWQQLATSPQDSTELKMAMFKRVVDAANTPGNATEDEIRLRDDVIEQIRQFRIFLAQDALDAYRAWKSGEEFRKNFYLRSQLQQAFDVGEVPPDFEDITLQTILGSLASSGAAATATGFAMTSKPVFNRLFPYAKRPVGLARAAASWKPSTLPFEAATEVIQTKMRSALGSGVGRVQTVAPTVANSAKNAATATRLAAEAAKTAGGLSSMVASIGPQIIISIGIEILAVAIEQQIDIANAEPKLKAGLATASNDRVDFKRLMATEAGTEQAIGYWSNLMAGPAARADGTRPAEQAPVNLQAFSNAANAAIAAL